jgi:hypothetical protein
MGDKTELAYLSGWVSCCCGAPLQKNVITHRNGGPDTEVGICSKCQSVLLCKDEAEVDTTEVKADADEEDRGLVK